MTELPTVTLPDSKTIQSAVKSMNGKQQYDLAKVEFDEVYSAVIPPEDPLYEPFGNYYDVERITVRGTFFPYWIYGLSGNGKTLSIEQAHARNKKRLVNIPITREADEDSLLGGLRLDNGSTVPFFGPVTLAAILGVTANLDEIDLGDERLMCLQTVMQNRPFLIKRLGLMIYPQPGFNITSTANTKGQGSEDGRFVGTNVMNEALLDRFRVTFEQDFPPEAVERKILHKVLASLGLETPKEAQFVTRLISWAKKIRETNKDMKTTEVMTTRRLVHVCHAYEMFGQDRGKAIGHCLARFTDPVKDSFREFYDLIDDSAKVNDAEAKRVADALAQGKDPETPFTLQ